MDSRYNREGALQLTYKLMQPYRVLRGVGDCVLSRLDGEGTGAKGQVEEAHPVDETAEGPDIDRGSHRLPPIGVEVNHLRCSVGQCGVPARDDKEG